MIGARKLLLMTPSRHGEFPAGYVSGLVNCIGTGLVDSYAFLESCSDPQLARDLIFHAFLLSDATHLLMVDDDILFEPRDVAILAGLPQEGVPWRAEWGPAPPTASADHATLDAAGLPLVTVGEYAERTDNLARARRIIGFGFVLIARSALERILAADRPDGSPMVGYFRHMDGTDCAHLAPAGPNFESRWVTEDHGFYHICNLIGIVPRLEGRVNLGHRGVMVFRLPTLPTARGSGVLGQPTAHDPFGKKLDGAAAPTPTLAETKAAAAQAMPTR